MLAYWCAECRMLLRPEELLDGKRCPECKGPARPRMMLGGRVIGSEVDNGADNQVPKVRR